jgi:hypothetical protein
VDSRPTSPRSWTIACWRSASTCFCALSVIRAACWFLSLLGLGDAALDRRGALGVDLLEARDDALRHDPVEDAERHEPEDQLDGVRDDRVRGRPEVAALPALGGRHREWR